MNKRFKPFLGILALVFLLSLATSENTSANSSELNVKINPVLQTSVNYEPITVDADGNLNISDVALKVSSNNRTGFKTYMSTAHETSEENATSLAYEDIDTVETLSENNLAAENFTMNKWGYSIDGGTTFNSVHAKDFAPSEVLATEKASDNGNINIQIGIKVNNEKASGKYTNTLLFTTIPNYVPLTLDDITYMQEATSEICTNTPTPSASDGEDTPQYQLKDSRDGKLYWVAKLADGDCWMTQNLDLDLDSSVALTPEDSDIARDWTPLRSTIQGYENLNADTWDSDGIDNGATPYSFNPGNYYFDGTADIGFLTCNIFAATCEHYSTTPYDSNGEHGHIGNYYNWSAAIAQNDTSNFLEGEANSSICPKGWKLPHGSYDAGLDYDSRTLAETYSGSVNQSSNKIFVSAPIFFVHSTTIGSYGYLPNYGNSSQYWTDTSDYVNGIVDVFNVDYDSFHSSVSGGGRKEGYNVRCIVRENKTLTIKNITDNSLIATYNFSASISIPEVKLKEGYNLIGYTEDKNSTTPTYNIGDTIAENKILYAIIEDTLPIMQNVSNWKDTLEIEQQIQVRDIRDNNAYWVAKLADGNIWMTQNLNYDLHIATNQTLTPETSNVSTTRTVIPDNSISSIFGTNNNAIYYMEDDLLLLKPSGVFHMGSASIESEEYHYYVGDYYSWKAATAGIGTTSITTNADINESICPAGWRLPTAGSSDTNYSFGNLLKHYGYSGSNQSNTTNENLLNSPLFLTRGGHPNGYSISSRGEIGNYWTSKAYSSNNLAYYFSFGDNYVNPNDTFTRYYGFSIRCVVQ